ncbi:hypothetical protein [Dysgonomonas sp. ZJ709]|uniref:hypothetical protein n=1 Tax=Dysgonomonas sp. ZJ709 TaxID=2709797 RepID=UPI0013ED0AF6|nr:hypothetical protein [Dysgonomonas sp. ZJ709]
MEVLTKPQKKKQFFLVSNVLTVFFTKTHFEMDSEYDGDYYVIRIRYTDGASLIRVKNAVKVFDCRANPAINFQGTKVIVERIMSPQIKNRIINEIKSVFAMDHLPKEDEWFQPIKGTIREYVDKIFSMRDFE